MRKASIAALTLGVLVTMAGLRVADLRWARTAAIETAESRAANLSLIIAAYLAETFSAGDASLRQLALHSRRVGGSTAPDRSWAPSLASAKAGLTSIGAITVIDRDGIIRHSTRTQIVGQSRRGDYIVRRSIDAANDDLVVSTPFKSLNGGLVLPIGRRLTTEEGAVDGAVVASFIPTVPQTFFRSVDVGERGTVWVFHPDGVLLFREPSGASALGQPAKDNPLFTAASTGGATGKLRAALTPAGPTLLSAYHTITTPPLIVAVSLDEEEMLADWEREVRGSLIIFAALSIMLAVTLFVLFRQMDAKARAEQVLATAQQLEAARLREANDRLASAFEREQNARREAEAASALKDQFLMTVSHELRTPLTAIYGWARMLVDDAVGERQRSSALRTIERNAHAQARLIDDLLDVSGVMGGKLRLDVRMVNVASVVQNAIDTVGPAATAKGITLETSFDPRADRISADPERLQQIAWNLLSNAVKFTPSGGRVRVTIAREGSDVEISVTDSGIGISPDFLPHVFERFRQEDGGTKRRFGGLGLGLAIVRSLVELHGGSVTAHSDGAERGATFVVRLPAIAGHAQAGSGVGTTGRTDAVAPVRIDGLRVLIVDDDPEARTLFATILDGAGAHVASVPSAAEAIARLRAASYDVLVSDIEMPEIDGYGLMHEAFAIARGRGERLMAVAVTAHSRPEDQARSLQAGFHRHVQKPVEPSALIAVVQAVWHEALNA